MSAAATGCAFAIRGLSPSEKLTLLALANFADDRMICWPSQATMAECTELSERTIWACMRSLEQAGIISRTKRHRPDGTRASDVVRLNFALVVARTPPVDISTTRKSCEMINPQIASDQPATVAGLTTFEPPLEEPVEASSPRTREAVWSERLDEAKAAGGDGLNLTIPALHTYRDLIGLCEPSSGEPCSWDEVLDAIRLEAAKARTRGKPIKSWLWVHESAIAMRDRRLAGLPQPRTADEIRRNDHTGTGRMAGGAHASGYGCEPTSMAGLLAQRRAREADGGSLP